MREEGEVRDTAEHATEVWGNPGAFPLGGGWPPTHAQAAQHQAQAAEPLFCIRLGLVQMTQLAAGRPCVLPAIGRCSQVWDVDLSPPPLLSSKLGS